MMQVSADHDAAVTEEDAADVAMDDHPAGKVAAEITDIHSAGRSGTEEDWDWFEAEGRPLSTPRLPTTRCGCICGRSAGWSC